MPAEDIIKDVALKLRPTGKQNILVNKVVEKINKAIKKAKIKAACQVAGSFAKGVYLENDFDVDLFVRFDLMYRNQNLSNILENILKKLYKIDRVKGSRDYFHFEEKLNFEVVPVLDIKKPGDAANITDFSPGHVKWVVDRLKRKTALRDEIRVTKQFLKAQGIYGAESFINGFSGHVVDILVINYGSFLNLLKAAEKWGEQEIIDVAKHYKKGDALYLLNKAKINNLIVIDPLQKERNAAAAISQENYDKFKAAAKVFLREPSEAFFEIRKLDLEKLRQKYSKNSLIIIKAKPKKGSTDIIGTKLYKGFLYIKQKLADNDFKLIEADWSWDKKHEAILWFALKKEMLPELYVRKGPSIKMKQHVMNFKMAHKKTFIKGSKIYAKVKRDYRTPESLIKSLDNDIYLKEKWSR